MEERAGFVRGKEHEGDRCGHTCGWGNEVLGRVTRDHIRGHRFKVWQRDLLGEQGTSSFLTQSPFLWKNLCEDNTPGLSTDSCSISLNRPKAEWPLMDTGSKWTQMCQTCHFLIVALD